MTEIKNRIPFSANYLNTLNTKASIWLQKSINASHCTQKNTTTTTTNTATKHSNGKLLVQQYSKMAMAEEWQVNRIHVFFVAVDLDLIISMCIDTIGVKKMYGFMAF